MKDTYKDVIKICKGFYNHDKYKDEIEALRAYQCKVCGINDEYITHDDLLNFGLFPTAEKYFKQKDWIEMLRERLWKNDILFQTLFHNNKVDFDGAYICRLLVRRICSLTVKTDNGEWIIDLSDYSNEDII